MALAIGGSSISPVQGELTVNVVDFGARSDNTSDNAAAFQAAVDAVSAMLLEADGTDRKGVVFIPASTGDYLLYNPVWVDRPDVEIRGDGLSSVVAIHPDYAHPAFIFGVGRGSGPISNVDPSYRQDLYPLFDVYAAYIPGIRWGFRTKGNACIQFLSSVLAEGVNRWTGSSTYTLEFCVAPAAGGPMPPTGFLLGLGLPSYPNPWVVTVSSSNTYSVIFRTSDQSDQPGGPTRAFTFSSGNATGPQKITIQWNFAAGKLTAYVNGTQVAVSGGGTFPAGLSFGTNEYWAFQMGGDVYAEQAEPAPSCQGADLIFYGYLLSAQLRYFDNGVGQPQARLNGQPITDGYRWFGKEHDNSLSTDFLGYLPLNNSPSQMDRLVPVVENGAPTTVGWVHMSDLVTGTKGNAIRDLVVVGANNRSQNIVLGSVTDFIAERVRSLAGFHAIGSLHLGAAYQICLRDCTLTATDSGYFGYYQDILAENVTFTSAGRTTVKMVGCSSNWNHVFVQGGPGCQSIFAFHPAIYGGIHRVVDLTADFEGDSVGKAGIYCANHPFEPASLTLEDCYLGTAADGASAVMLRDTGPAGVYRRAWASIRNVQTSNNPPGAYLTVDGPLWHGEVWGLQDTPGTRIAHLQTWGTATNVVLHDTTFAAPPREDFWLLGAHILDVRSCPDGQFTRWHCVGTGQYGTPQPPIWAGSSPACSSAGSLAGTVSNHVYIQAAITP